MQLGKPKIMKVEYSLSPPQVTEVSASPIICDDLSVQLMVHKDHNRHHKYPGWLVSEYSTGVRIGNNPQNTARSRDRCCRQGENGGSRYDKSLY